VEALDDFAEAHALGPAPELPHEGGLLGEDDLRVEAAATGPLPGGIEGTLAHLAYTYRSDDSTKTRRLTTVVARVPESIGFLPYAADAYGAVYGARCGHKTKSLRLDGDVRLQVDAGADETWLAELFSPALRDWLARSPEGFGFELASGVLAVSVPGHLSSESELTRLCEDAARLAAALRTESLEEVETGGAARSAAKRKRDPHAVLVAELVPLIEFERPPADVAAAIPAYRALVTRHGSTYFIAAIITLAWTLIVNVVGGGIFVLLLNLPNPLAAVVVFEVVVLATVGAIVIRHEIKSRSRACAAEAFWTHYARSRRLEAVDPLEFAATHARAGLPGQPERVFAGSVEGVDGALVITGDGLKRGDAIALVAGPIGPVARADFEASAPGPSARLLDSCAERLASGMRAAQSARATRTATAST
jgi:hypothetical protein